MKPYLMSATNLRSCPQTALHFLGDRPQRPSNSRCALGATRNITQTSCPQLQTHRAQCPPTGPRTYRDTSSHKLPPTPPPSLPRGLNLPCPPTPNPHLQAPNSSFPLRNKFKQSSMRTNRQDACSLELTFKFRRETNTVTKKYITQRQVWYWW